MLRFKSKLYITTVLLCVVVPFLVLSFFSVSAYEDGGYPYEEGVYSYSHERIAEIWDNIALCPIEAEPLNISAVTNMDVSESGEVAIILNLNNILLYDSEGNYLEGYKFNSSGDDYIKWKGDALCLYRVRSNSVIEFTKDIKLINIYQISSRDSVWDEFKFKDTLINDGVTYKLTNNMGPLFTFLNGGYSGLSYTTLRITDVNGTDIVVYNAIFTQIIKVFLILFIMLFFPAAFLFGLYKADEKKRKENR